MVSLSAMPFALLVAVQASKCCYDADLTVDQCPSASDCDGAGDYCSASSGNCGDCGGVFCTDSPSPTPAPTPTPTPEPEGEAKCCYDDGLTPDQCSTASDCDGAGDYCSASAGNCGDCGGVFCKAGPSPTPTPMPSPTPSPAPQGESKCCYDADLTVDQCPTASDCDDASDYCSASAGNCGDCGGVFCTATPAPTPPAPSPAPVKAFKCVDGQCVPGEGGIDRKSCKSLCAPVAKYKCNDNQCVEDQDGVSKETCQAFCGSHII